MNKRRSAAGRWILGAVLSTVALVLMLVLIYVEYYMPAGLRAKVRQSLRIGAGIVEQENCFYTHFIDVGQADCTLLKYNSSVVLIDAGDIDSFGVIGKYLDDLGVTEINYLILTHMHTDHMGSADRILENYSVDNVLMTRAPEELIPTNEFYSRLLDTLKNYDGNVIEARAGDSYTLDGFGFTVLAPLGVYEELNNYSIVIKADSQGKSFLFMGDAEKQSEKDLIQSGADLKSDVLKVGHHGSSTSSRAAFVSAVSPKIAVISCGRDNAYGHPNRSTLNNLGKTDAEVFRTDIDGNVVIECKEGNLTVITENSHE